jgi:glycosyltransferase involved in cell wall biosynthesis
MKILILNYEFYPIGGGASSVAYEIARKYVHLKNQVDVLTMHYKGLPSFEVIDGIQVYRIKCIRKRKEICHTHEMVSFILSSLLFLRKFLRNKKYDICHCHFLIPTGILAIWIKKKYGLDYIITTHGSDVPGYNPDRFIIQHKFTKPLLKKICKNAKKICSPSLFLSNLIKENIATFDIQHIPNGINLNSFKLNLNRPKENMILSTGRLLKRKGFHTLIKAVYDANLPFEVHIAGDGPFRNKLEKMAQGSSTRIVFHGWLDKNSHKLYDLYERAKIYVLASSKENASIALLEAMAAKTVIISTAISGCPETIGNAGFLINYGDEKKLRELLLRLIKKPELIHVYSERAYNRLLDKFLWDKIILKYIKLLDQ